MKLDKHLIVKTAPVALKENIVFWQDYRVTVLGEKLFRLEKSKNHIFRDDATQSVWFRNFEKQDFTTEEGDNFLKIITKSVTIILMKRRRDCKIILNGKTLPIDNSENLLGTYRTLDCCDGNLFNAHLEKEKQSEIKLGVGVCSKNGVAVIDDSKSLTLNVDGTVAPVVADGSDEYIFAFGDDYEGAVKNLFKICGKTPLIPKFALGNWWSRYYRYTDRSYLTLLNKFKENDIPLTVATIDMDWHYSDFVDEEKGISKSGRNTDFYGGNNGWTGYSWNKNLFPDYKSFLKEIKKFGLKITLNLHPADGIRWWEDQYEKMAKAVGVDPSTGEKINFNIADTNFINNYFKILHKPFEKDGVSFWWIDWQQGEKSEMEGLDPLWSLNHYHYLDNALTNKNPLILSRYSGVGSHRYPLGFSGDTLVTWKTLKFLPYFTATASNVGYTWWSHDIGGHMLGETDFELYLRHLQFGVFSPINRLHSSNALTVSKEPWYYKNGVGELAKKWLKIRHSLIPLIYSKDYETFEEGNPLIKPLYYKWKNEEAYTHDTEYLFADKFIVAPITEKINEEGYATVKVWLPNGVWTDIFTGDEYVVEEENGNEILMERNLDSIPVLAGSGAILPLSLDKGNSIENPRFLEIDLFNGDGSFVLNEDDKHGKKCTTTFIMSEIKNDENTIKNLTILSNRNNTASPSERKLKIVFKNHNLGDITLKINGKQVKVEKDFYDEDSITINYNPKNVYEITHVEKNVSLLEKQKNRLNKIMCSMCVSNQLKDNLYNALLRCKDVKEFVTTVSKSKLPDSDKRRILETI